MILSVNSGIKEGRGLKTYLGLEFFSEYTFLSEFRLIKYKINTFNSNQTD